MNCDSADFHSTQINHKSLRLFLKVKLDTLNQYIYHLGQQLDFDFDHGLKKFKVFVKKKVICHL